MSENKQLYEFMMSRVDAIAEQWLKARKENIENSFYQTDKARDIQTFQQESSFFAKELSRLLVGEEKEAYENLTQWANRLVQKRARMEVPLNEVIEQFKKYRVIYLAEVEKFVLQQNKEHIYRAFFGWNRIINMGFDSVIKAFTRYYYKFSIDRLKAQQEMIRELSTPVILIKQEVGVLPLIGDVDTERAKVIMQSALEQCSEKQVKRLFIDLSGVAIIDTMVAQQIFQVIFSLKLIGVTAILSGVRPEVAQTAVQLGVNFDDIFVEGNLARALASVL